MFERDYLMNMLMQFFRGMMRANELRLKKDDPDLASRVLEDLIQESLDLDGAALLQLDSDSIAQVMRVMEVDPHITEFIGRALLLDAIYLDDAHQNGLASTRRAQAYSIAREYCFELPDELTDFESIMEGLEVEDPSSDTPSGSIDLDEYLKGL